MPPRTYIPGLEKELEEMNRYATRYTAQLSANLTAPQYTCLLAVIEAVQACLASLTPHTPEPPE